MSNENTAATDAPQPSTPQPVRDDLQARKLELEIAALERPWFKRPNFYINAAVATTALVGIVGQRHLSNIEVASAQLVKERAVLKTNELLEQAKDAEKRLVVLKSQESETRKEADKAQSDLEVAKRQIEKVKEDERKYRTLSQLRKEEYRLLLAQIKKLQSEGAIEPDASAKLSNELAENVRRRVHNIIAALLGIPPEEIKEEHSLVDLRADSLDTVELVMELEDTFEITIPDEDAEHIFTVGDIVCYVTTKLKAS